MIQRIEPHRRLSGAVVHGGVVYISGTPLTPHATVAVQTREILLKIDGLLEAAGSDKRRLLSVSIWLADITTFKEMNTAWDAWVPHDAPPARTTVEACIANPAWRVEISAVAALDAGD